MKNGSLLDYLTKGDGTFFTFPVSILCLPLVTLLPFWDKVGFEWSAILQRGQNFYASVFDYAHVTIIHLFAFTYA